MSVLSIFVCASLLLFPSFAFLPQRVMPQAVGRPPQRDGDLLLIQNEPAGLRGTMAFHITGVKLGGPAARAGLRENDLILAVDERPVRRQEELEKTILQPFLNPGASYVVTIGRFNVSSGRLDTLKQVVKAN